jgi:hypothetical protein
VLSYTFSGYDNSHTPGKSPIETYSKVKIYINSAEDIGRLQSSGIDIEHFTGDIEHGVEVVINRREIGKLKASGFRYDILINNTDDYYRNLPPPSAEEMRRSQEILQTDDVEGFTYGSMGGYYTYAEMVLKLDSLRMRFANFISPKINIGSTTEGRTIWAVKISDNPLVNESATEPVIYFDALHHAREPQSMASLFYYMYWLLENFYTNPEAQYLINNREIYFVPIVNPDGYVYNQTTNPNGGGMWRKNRRNNGGGSFGVDLNRNYPFGWGLNTGSSADPNDEAYRGPSAGSELETQRVITLVNNIKPKIAFSMHSVAGRYLNPYGYIDSSVAYDVYSDFSSEFAQYNDYTYGTVIEMLSYFSSGTARDYLHSQGTYCWTPEVGGSGFWPNISEIVPVASENMHALKYLSWVGGSYPKLNSYMVVGNGYVQRNDTLQLQIAVRNKGLSRTSKNVRVELASSYGNIAGITSAVNYDSIQARQTKVNTSTPFKFRITNGANFGDNIKFICTVKEDGRVASMDTFFVTVGKVTALFSDNAENGTSNWVKSGNGIQWDTTSVSSWLGGKSFADSRYGNSDNNTNNFFTLSQPISLSGRVSPRVEFAAKWGMEAGSDYTRFQVSTNNGSTWINLAGRYTKTVGGQPAYTDVSYWVYEQINLTPYIGQTVRLRFNYVTDPSIPGDGFYFDNFRVIDYTSTTTGISSTGNEVPEKFELYQNYPNPFNPVTKIKFDLPENGAVSVSVYDITGKEVAVLHEGELRAGSYEINYDASALTSGIYFYRFTSSTHNAVKKMMVLK